MATILELLLCSTYLDNHGWILERPYPSLISKVGGLVLFLRNRLEV